MTYTKEQLLNQARENVKALKMAVVQNAFKDIRPAIELDLALAELALAGMEAESVVISDDMAYAFHHAFTDSSLGADEVEEIKTGLRAAFANVAAPQPLTTSERAELENYRKAQLVVPGEYPDDSESVCIALERCRTRNGAFQRYKLGWDDCRAAMLQGADGRPELTVSYGPMPESNGKTNWTAILHRKGQGMLDGITIDRSEYPGRVLYAADRARYLIGEKPDRPFILDYDADKHSGYVAPCKAGGNSPVIQEGWVTVPVEMTPEQMRAVQLNSELGSYAAENLSGAYALFAEFWRVASNAAPQSGAVKDVLPEPIKDTHLNSGPDADDYYSGYQEGWNECLETISTGKQEAK